MRYDKVIDIPGVQDIAIGLRFAGVMINKKDTKSIICQASVRSGLKYLHSYLYSVGYLEISI